MSSGSLRRGESSSSHVRGTGEMVKLMEALLAQHRADIAQAIEHGIQRERAWSQNQMAAMKSDAEQSRLELAEEKSRHANLLQELEDLRFSASAESHRRVQADERAHHAEEERKEILGQLAKALNGWTLAEKWLREEQERTSQLCEELTVLQR